ncbi:FMN-dependent NADH-azoreductase [Sneathiella chinensis]|uniref:FMN dependent NADH:quinone oxidoreductase n=1 Tax=Sneathiella chinensis TaxID=349750 RepID=A0ABQ5U8A7_9PROT|nr:FMN-dependent NADH-azoreductase [Sneathiella chinensis]GLQ07428.1 FMN-dependent NADH-azoreductase [Sneathiella chinensis]
MVKVLHLKSSILGDAGQSNQLSQRFVDQYLSTVSGSSVTLRDLGENPVPHLTGEAVVGFGLPDAERTAAQTAAKELSDALIAELRDHDVLVIGLPMYNFSIPSTLKAWIDYVARVGETFRYTETGPEGLLKGKKAYVIAARGGKYVGTPADTQTSFMKTILGFVGITDVEFIFAEGLNMGDEARTAGLTEAEEEMGRLIAETGQAAA